MIVYFLGKKVYAWVLSSIIDSRFCTTPQTEQTIRHLFGKKLQNNVVCSALGHKSVKFVLSDNFEIYFLSDAREE